MITQEHRDWVEKVLAEHDVPPLPEDSDGGHHLLGLDRRDRAARSSTSRSSTRRRCSSTRSGRRRKDIVDAAHEHGIKVAALASSPRHAQKHVDIGVDIVVAQGTEAGGHTGEISSVVLWPQVIDAVAPTAGARGRWHRQGSQIAARARDGRAGRVDRSIWLTVAESDMTPLVIEKLLAADSTQTVRSARCPASRRASCAPSGPTRGTGPIAPATSRCRCSTCSSPT